MKRRYTNATLVTALLGVSFSSAAWAGEGTKGQAAPQAPMRAAIAAHLFERMDENKDGQVTRQEALAASQRLFQRLDGNADGELTKAESEAGTKAMREQELSTHFKQLDANGDGRLTVAESQLPQPVFDRLDANKDKALTLAEMQAGPDKRAEQRDFQFDQSDVNHDGKVTRDEAEKSAGSRFDSIDQSHDGVVTRAELEAHVAQIMKQGGAKPHEGAH
jgi:Ca2+-binding EF-hand superfamily protein